MREELWCWGRAAELERLDAQVVPGALITVTGAPGVGKSAVLGRWVETRGLHKKIVRVALGGVGQRAELFAALARALALVWEDDGADDEAARGKLWRALAAQQIEAVALDEVEAVAAPLAELLSLRAGAPQVAWVVGARALLGVEGEQAVRVPVWRTGGVDAEATLAMRALIEREGLRVEEAELPTLATLAARLDGVPLAMRLSAARCRIIKPAQQLQRLDAGRPLAGEEVITRALELSWEALGPPARERFLACGVFAGSWSAEAAEAVLGEDALAHMDQLARGSLISQEGGRWHMLRIVSRFARAQHLEQRPQEAETLLVRLLGWLARQSWRAYTQGHGDPWSPQADALIAERANLQRALEWALETSAHVPALDVVWALLGLSLCLMRAGELGGLRDWNARVEARVGDAPEDARVQGALLLCHADALSLKHRSGEAFELLHAAYHARSSWPEALDQVLLLRLVHSSNHAYQPDAGRDALDAWRARYADAAPLHTLAWSALAEGQLATYTHDYARGLERLELATTLADQLGWLSLRAHAQMVEMFACQFIHDLPRARRAIDGCIEAFDALARHDGLAHALLSGAWLCVDLEALDQAEALLGRLAYISEQHGVDALDGEGHLLRGLVALERGDAALASARYERAALTLAREGDPDLLAAARLYHATSTATARSLDEGARLLDALLETIDAVPSRWGRIQIWCAEAALAAGLGHHARAEAALALATQARPADNEALLAQLHVLRAVLDWCAHLEDLGARRHAQATRRAMSAVTTLAAVFSASAGEPPLWSQSQEIRQLVRLLWAALDATSRRRLALAVADPDTSALVLDLSARAVRAPHDAVWAELSGRHILWRLLTTLCEAHAQRRRIPAPELCALLWPAEAQETPLDVLTRRLYVTVSELRGEGLGEVVSFDEGRGGYGLPEGLVVVTSPLALPLT